MGHLTEGNWNNVDDLRKDDFTHGYAQYKGIYTIIDLTVIKPDYLKRIATKASANGENFPKTYDDRKGEYLLLKNFGPYIGRDYDKCYFNSIDDIINTLKGLNESMNIKDRIRAALDEDKKIRQNTRWSEEDQPKLYMIDRFLRKDFDDCVVIITQDGIPKDRIEEMKSSEIGYKEGRPELEFNFYEDIPLIRACCGALNDVYWAYNEDKECDDLMYALAKQAQRTSFEGKTFIYSGDNDLLQAIDERTSVIRKKKKNSSEYEEITSEVVRNEEVFTKKFHGVDPEHIIYFRVLCGDSSDKIKGIPRFPRDLAVKISMECNELEDLFKFNPVTEKERKYCKLIEENREIIERNYRLMKLTDDFEVNLSKKIPNVEVLKKTLEKLELNSFLKYLEEGE